MGSKTGQFVNQIALRIIIEDGIRKHTGQDDQCIQDRRYISYFCQEFVFDLPCIRGVDQTYHKEDTYIISQHGIQPVQHLRHMGVISIIIEIIVYDES